MEAAKLKARSPSDAPSWSLSSQLALRNGHAETLVAKSRESQ